MIISFLGALIEFAQIVCGQKADLFKLRNNDSIVQQAINNDMILKSTCLKPDDSTNVLSKFVTFFMVTADLEIDLVAVRSVNYTPFHVLFVKISKNSLPGCFWFSRNDLVSCK